MSIPLVQNNEKDSINTSIIAIKRNIERINMLLGLVDNDSPDLSGFATKQELQDAVTELQPVDEVTVGNMQSVSSNAVARAFGDWELIADVSYDTAIFRVYGKNTTKGKYLWFHLNGYATGSTVTIGTQLIGLPTSWVNQNETRRCIIFADLPNGRLPADIDINPTGVCNLYPALPNQYTGQVTLGYGLFGDAIVYMS